MSELLTGLFRWLIVGVHEPKYSSTQPSAEFATGTHLTSDIENELGEALLPQSPRTGYLGYQMLTALEPLFYQYGVDLVLTGHEHNYERSYPVYMDKVCATAEPAQVQAQVIDQKQLVPSTCSIICLFIKTV